MDAAYYRSLFPITRDTVFLNHAAIAPTPLKATKAACAFHMECAFHGSLNYGKWLQKLEKIRNLSAGLIGAGSHEIAFVGNTSEGLGKIAEGFIWQDGDVILVPAPDFPANIYPWMHLERKGVKVRFVERREGRITVNEVKKTLVAGAKMLTVSSVDFAGGFAADLGELGEFCRRKNLFFCVDAIQSMGAIPLNVKECGIHFLAAGGHKWMLGPMGTGILFVDEEVQEEMIPPLVGWKSVRDEESYETHFELKKNAAKFEPGTLNLAGVFGLGESLELLADVGINLIYKRVLELNDLFIDGLKQRGLKITSPLKPDERSGILTFTPPGNPAHCFRFLSDRKVMVSLRQGQIRLAPHFYNNEEDIGKFFEVIDDFLRR